MYYWCVYVGSGKVMWYYVDVFIVVCDCLEIM